jgi:hypothetical protein
MLATPPVVEAKTDTKPEPKAEAHVEAKPEPPRPAPAADPTPSEKPKKKEHRFDDVEEEFFRQSDRFAAVEPPPEETFADLDEGAPPPQGFWQRLFRRNATPAAPAPAQNAGKPKKK